MSKKIILLASFIISAQVQAESYEYSFKDVTVDDPDLYVGAGLGLALPGSGAFEVFAQAHDLALDKTYLEARYLSSSGFVDETLLADASSFTLRAGWKLQSEIVADSDKLVLEQSSSDSVEGNRRVSTTVTQYIPVVAPKRKETIIYGLFEQRNALLVTEREEGIKTVKDKENVSSNMLGFGIKIQESNNYSAEVKGRGIYRENVVQSHAVELLNGSGGVYQGLHWQYVFESMSLPWTWRGTVGTAISGLADEVDYIDTFVVSFGFGYYFTKSVKRMPTRFNAECWQKSQSVENCKV